MTIKPKEQKQKDQAEKYKLIPWSNAYGIKHSQIKLHKQNGFRQHMLLEKPGSVKPFVLKDISIRDIWKDKSLNIQWRTQQIEKRNKGREAIFITLTADGFLHSRNWNWRTEKGDYATDRQIKEAEQILNNLQDEYRKYLREVLKYAPDYIMTIEQHKDKTPHLHCMFYIQDGDGEVAMNVINNKIDRSVSLKTGIGQRDKQKVLLIKADEASNPLRYIGKYITKATKSDLPLEDLYAMDGYYRHFKIRQFRTSNVPIPYRYAKSIIQYLKDQLGIYNILFSDVLNWAWDNVEVVHRTNFVKGLLEIEESSTKKIKHSPKEKTLTVYTEMNRIKLIMGSKMRKITTQLFSPITAEVFSDSRDWVIRRSEYDQSL